MKEEKLITSKPSLHSLKANYQKRRVQANHQRTFLKCSCCESTVCIYFRNQCKLVDIQTREKSYIALQHSTFCNHVLALTSMVCVTMEFGCSFKHLPERSIRSDVAFEPVFTKDLFHQIKHLLVSFKS